MSDKLQRLVHTFAALADLGQEIADTGDFDEMVRTSLHLMLGALAIRRGAITEFDAEARVLRFIATRGIEEQVPEYVAIDSESISDLLCAGPCTVNIGDSSVAVTSFAGRYRNILGTNLVELLLPLIVRDKLVGLIFLGEKASGKAFSEDDREVLSAMGRHIGVGIQERRQLEELELRATENRELYEGLRAIYHDTVKAFAAAIDCKDKYTRGHSERVGTYSEIIAREMGLSDNEVEGIAVAGYLHDIGKLVVERDILNAPYYIDAKQSAELNRHPSAGYEILAPIHHPYADISMMVRYHHERMDGAGYPEGLIGDQIPVGARIVALADAFDAMTTDRPYRRRRSLDEVVIDLRDNVGKQFAADAVASLCRAVLKEVKGESSERRIVRMLGKGYVEPERTAPLLAELIAELDSSVMTSAAGRA
jgi:HD-GYP domain-containing protein (c-di-GMP phosphodiesterase class II)